MRAAVGRAATGRAPGRRGRAALLVAAMAVVATACGGDPALLVFDVDSPAGPGSAEPNLTVGPDGFYMSWLEPSGPDRHTLRFARWDGEAWSEPRTVIDRSDLFVNWADFPSMVVLEDGTLAAHWLEKSGPATYAYDVRMAVSRDGGESWSEDVIPHRDSVQAEHGFVALYRDDGRIGAVWLDGRETVDGHPMTLRSTTLGRDGGLGPEILLDPATCDCCQTDVALADGNPVAVYRGRTPGEVRDIRVVRRLDGRWTDPTPVHRDGWVIEACPVNGPAIDASGQRVAVAWFTAAPERPADGVTVSEDEPGAEGHAAGGEDGRVLLAFSEDGGATFGAPVRVDRGGAMGRVDVELLEGGAAVTWVQRTADGAVIMFRIFDREGTAINGATLGATSASRISGFPRMAAEGDRLLFAYTAPDEDGTTRVGTLRAVLGDQEAAR